MLQDFDLVVSLIDLLGHILDVPSAFPFIGLQQMKLLLGFFKRLLEQLNLLCLRIHDLLGVVKLPLVRQDGMRETRLKVLEHLAVGWLGTQTKHVVENLLEPIDDLKDPLWWLLPLNRVT